MAYELDYDQMIILDAEELAEGGVKRAYERLLPQLRRFVAAPTELVERLNDDGTVYVVSAMDQEFPITGPDLNDDEGQSWGRATHALFTAVNEQLASSSHRLYALRGQIEIR